MTSPNFKKKILEAHEYKPSLWVKGFVNEAGLPLEFSDHRFLIDIFNDLNPLQVVLKAPQVGMTTTNVLKALWVASHLDKQIIYTLPTQSDVYDMVGGGFNRIIAQNQILKELVAETDTMEHKSVGKGLIRFRGTFTTKQAMMVPSDLNIHDEVDASDAGIITQYETRLQAKANGWRWYFSHPTTVGRGVDLYWKQSDQKEWFVTCRYCKMEQTLSWPDSIDEVLKEYVCKRCHLAFEKEDRRMGEWRKTSDGKFSGYHISQLMCPWIPATKILSDFNDQSKTKDYFYNYVLGLPYAESDDRISPETVLSNVVPDVNEQQGTIAIGVDTGLPIYYVCMNKQGVFHHGTLPKDNPYGKLEQLLLRWPKAIINADQGGDLIGIRQLQQKYVGRVFLTYYRKDRKTAETVKWGTDGSVVVDRNRMITLVAEHLRDRGRLRFNGTVEDWKPFAEHFGHVFRLKEETPFGMEYKWERNGPDHYVHALVYAIVGYDRFAEQEAGIVQAENWLDDLPKSSILDL